MFVPIFGVNGTECCLRSNVNDEMIIVANFPYLFNSNPKSGGKTKNALDLGITGFLVKISKINGGVQVPSGVKERRLKYLGMLWIVVVKVLDMLNVIIYWECELL